MAEDKAPDEQIDLVPKEGRGEGQMSLGAPTAHYDVAKKIVLSLHNLNAGQREFLLVDIASALQEAFDLGFKAAGGHVISIEEKAK